MNICIWTHEMSIISFIALCFFCMKPREIILNFLPNNQRTISIEDAARSDEKLYRWWILPSLMLVHILKWYFTMWIDVQDFQIWQQIMRTYIVTQTKTVAIISTFQLDHANIDEISLCRWLVYFSEKWTLCLVSCAYRFCWR